MTSTNKEKQLSKHTVQLQTLKTEMEDAYTSQRSELQTTLTKLKSVTMIEMIEYAIFKLDEEHKENMKTLDIRIQTYK